MTRQALLSLIAAAPALAFGGRDSSKTSDGDVLRLMPGTYTIAAGGGMYVSKDYVRFEGCTFDPDTRAKSIELVT
jgi:hypothetical protein